MSWGMEKLLAAERPRAGDPREAAVRPRARGPRCCGALRLGCQDMEYYSVSTEQMLIFFLAVWFFYFFYLQDF